MISANDALKLVLKNPWQYSGEMVSLFDADHRVLDQDIRCAENIPPYNRVAMDGVAVSSSDTSLGIQDLISNGIQSAGVPPLVLHGNGHCIEVMTGGVLPQNADCIIPYEQLKRTTSGFHLTGHKPAKGDHIHFEGSDKRKGDILISQGTSIGTAELGALASNGNIEVPVRKLPRTTIFSTGNELVEPGISPMPHQVRKSNIFMIENVLRKFRISTALDHLDDNKDQMRNQIERALSNADLLIMSGAVSKGQFDFLPSVLQDAGVECIFHGVKQKPGKPFWFGKKENKFVFAFPGNPVSTMVCMMVYLVPWLRMNGNFNSYFPLIAKSTFQVVPSRELKLFLQVSVSMSAEGYLSAELRRGNGSGDYSNLILADGFIEVDPGEGIHDSGRSYPLHLYRGLL